MFFLANDALLYSSVEKQYCSVAFKMSAVITICPVTQLSMCKCLSFSAQYPSIYLL